MQDSCRASVAYRRSPTSHTHHPTQLQSPPAKKPWPPSLFSSFLVQQQQQHITYNWPSALLSDRAGGARLVLFPLATHTRTTVSPRSLGKGPLFSLLLLLLPEHHDGGIADDDQPLPALVFGTHLKYWKMLGQIAMSNRKSALGPRGLATLTLAHIL